MRRERGLLTSRERALPKTLAQYAQEWIEGYVQFGLQFLLEQVEEVRSGGLLREWEEDPVTGILSGSFPKRRLLFSAQTSEPVPASVDGQWGVATVTGAPKCAFKPMRIIVAGTTVPTSQPGGTKGLLITELFMGGKAQLLNVPGSQSGIPVETFRATEFMGLFDFDILSPVLPLEVRVANPTRCAAALFNMTMVGDSVEMNADGSVL